MNVFKNFKKCVFFTVVLGIIPSLLLAQLTKKFKPKISGTVGVTYQGYGLDRDPNLNAVYTRRRPWNQVRFIFNPTIEFSKNFKLPVNLNLAAFPTNFAGAYAGLKKQSIGQFLTNPINAIGLNPTYKWAEFQLGTQYLSYSDLSTGDVGVFGAGFSLKPNNFIVKFFSGISQQGVDPFGTNPGSYKRTHTMVQLGKEREGEYKIALNFVKGNDVKNSVTPSPLLIPAAAPQETFNVSAIAERNFSKGYFTKIEGATNIYTTNTNAFIPPSGVPSFKPFITGRTSTQKGYGFTGKVGKKSENFDIGLTTKYLDAKFFTMGYPYMQNDRIDITVDTRFNFLKNKDGGYKSNVVASVGQRTNNLSTATKANQFIGNINWFTQFNDNWSLNVNFNNFGFQTGTASSAFSVKNVSNDVSVSPTYTWTTTKMVNTLSLNYSYSKYLETYIVPPAPTTTNVTHTIMLNYIPVYLNRKITPDFSVLYFNNNSTFLDMSILTISAGLGMPMLKEKLMLKGQLQYSLGKLGTFSANNNLIASLTANYKINKKLTWNTWMNGNFFKYGNELSNVPPLLNAQYLESILKTGLLYKF